MNDKYDDRIVRLLQLYMIGEITDEERQELEVWRDKNEENRRFFEDICHEKLFAGEVSLFRKIDEVKALRHFERLTGNRGGKVLRRYMGVGGDTRRCCYSRFWLSGYGSGDSPGRRV